MAICVAGRLSSYDRVCVTKQVTGNLFRVPCCIILAWLTIGLGPVILAHNLGIGEVSSIMQWTNLGATVRVPHFQIFLHLPNLATIALEAPSPFSICSSSTLPLLMFIPHTSKDVSFTSTNLFGQAKSCRKQISCAPELNVHHCVVSIPVGGA